MGWVPRRANTFEKLDRIGQGTYSNVYKARDVTHGKIVAIKKVRFDSNDPESVKFMSREILILRGLDHPNIIKLEGLITSQTSSSLYLVFEYMEHDLTGLAALPGVKFTEAQHNAQSLASRYGVAVDLWSAGCILGELYSGRPILPGRTEVEQLHKIFKLCGSPSEDYWIKTKLPRSSVIKTQRPYRRCVNETFKDFPAPAVGLMENLLSMDPAHRGTAAFALTSEFFKTKPFACDPSSLPKYPPSKEIDAKLRDEEARRQEVAARRSGPRESLAPNGYPHLPTSLQKKHNSVSHNSGRMDNYHKEQTVSGFMIGPSERGQALREGRGDFMERQRKKVSHSGPLVQGNGWTRTGKNFDNHNMVSGRHNLSTISGLVATRTILPGDDQEKPGVPQPEVVKQVGRLQGSINGLESSRRVDQNCQIQKMRYSPQAGAGKSGNKEPSLHGHGPQGNKIYVSGPLLVPSNNVEQMLKEHDRQIQDFARRRLDKTKLVKLKAQGKQPTDGGLMVTSRH
ncbi:CELL DIVISION PROTEIN KINASE [Salix purpurea]|uniref:CELL DIVISION PROTEIN KINASE n=1 Tax=Salix purpurea TaxID=77065 RepID=A0A9Q1AAH0_SALPP|nr:CELL DIVISION PROTEIN KINASE [Salix purpurea]KAJ6763874.1 CELL DIVISION PROTEIN KINASE [Salix purpurea]